MNEEIKCSIILPIYNVEQFLGDCLSSVAVGQRKIYCYRRDNSASAMTKFALHKAEMALHAIDVIRENLTAKTPKLMEACRYAEWHMADDMYNRMVLARAKKVYPEVL